MSRTKKTKSEPRSGSPEHLHPYFLAEKLISSHSTLSEHLARWREQKSTPPVLLLTGPRGCGKREMAYWIAMTVQCERSGFGPPPETDSLFGAIPSSIDLNETPRPCGECTPCLRMLHSQALDFEEIRTLEDKSTFGVDQFRELKEKQGFSAYEGNSRIFLISDVERMTPAAFNSILKILEEPPRGWIFLMTTTDSSLLPSTVVSRCQVLRLGPLSEKVIQEILQHFEVKNDRRSTVARLAEGSLTRALALSEDRSWEVRTKILEFLVHPQKHFHALVDYASAETPQFSTLLDHFESLLNDLLKSSELPAFNAILNVDASPWLDQHRQKCLQRSGNQVLALRFWIDRAERIFKLRREITTPLSLKILAQDFLAPWMDAV